MVSFEIHGRDKEDYALQVRNAPHIACSDAGEGFKVKANTGEFTL